MLPLKSFIKTDAKEEKTIPVAYGSIGNKKDPFQPASSIPAVYASIGKHKDPFEHDIKQQVVKAISHMTKSHHPAYRVFNSLSHKHSMTEYYEHGTNKSEVDAGKPAGKFVIPKEHKYDEPPVNTHLHGELEKHYGHDDYNVRDTKKNNKGVWHYVGGSSELNGALIGIHERGHDVNNRDHHYSHHLNVLHNSWGEPRDEEDENYRHQRAREQAETTHEVVKHLNKVIDDSPPLHKDIHVYTGIGHKFDIQKLRDQGHDKVHLPAYTSTSIEPGVARGFSRTGPDKPHQEMIRIKLPAGSKHGTYLGSTGLHHEKEFLLKHGKTLKFVGAPRVVDHYTEHSDEHQHYIVHDAEIHEEEKK